MNKKVSKEIVLIASIAFFAIALIAVSQVSAYTQEEKNKAFDNYFKAWDKFNQTLDRTQPNIEGLVPKINEDQVITCISDVSDSPTRGSLICHIFDADDLDWYYEINQKNYGLLGDLNDSFSMSLVD
jgi:hypothetical protein